MTTPLPPGHTRSRCYCTCDKGGDQPHVHHIQIDTYNSAATTDRTDADDATFEQVLERIENTPACDESVEGMARRFHEAYERLAPRFGYETRPASAVPWEQVPQQNRQALEAAAQAVRKSKERMGVPPVLAQDATNGDQA